MKADSCETWEKMVDFHYQILPLVVQKSCYLSQWSVFFPEVEVSIFCSCGFCWWLFSKCISYYYCRYIHTQIHEYIHFYNIYIYIIYIYDTCIHIVYTYNTWTKYVRFLLLVAFEAEDSFERSEASQMDRDATRWGSWESYRFSAVFLICKTCKRSLCQNHPLSSRDSGVFFVFRIRCKNQKRLFLKDFW